MVEIKDLNNQQLAQLGLKYNLIDKSKKYTRNDLIILLENFQKRKQEQQQTRHDPNIKSISVNNQRRNSVSGSQQSKDRNGPPKPSNNRRRLSEPNTAVEKQNAVHTHQMNQVQQQSVKQLNEQMNANNPKYDRFGIYPAVKKLVCIGDIHGDLSVALKVLKLAEVIPQNSNMNNLDNIHWSGNDTWVIQLGDQIDRCRPEEWDDKDCIVDFDEVVQDEGSNRAIIRLFFRLDDEARKVGGRLLGTLGNHELMNVDKDFRYVSPQEFLEWVPPNERTSKYTKDGYPLGYYHRLKAFQRGGNISKLYADRKKSIIIIGSYVFVHGGLSIELMEKYKIAEINDVVTRWLLNTDPEQTSVESKIFDEIFRQDDDMSPFWCRIFAEEEDNPDNTARNFVRLLQLINKNNKLLMPVKGMVISHTPQYMENKYLNSMYNDRLWRIDVGMSRAFGPQDECGANKMRKPQILIIHNDSQFEKRIVSLNSDRYPSSNQGQKVDINNEFIGF
jgi:hypothetical protein